MTADPSPDSSVSIRLLAAFHIKEGARWWPPTRDRYVASAANSLNPSFAWTNEGLEYRVLRQQLVPYGQVLQVDAFPLKQLVQRGWVVSSDRTGVVVSFEGAGRRLLAVPATPALLRQAIEQAQRRGIALGAGAQALLASGKD